MPPTAAIIGRRACLAEESSPWINSLLISKVTKKKKTAIRTSLIQCKTVNFIPIVLKPINKYLERVPKYNSDKFELLIIKAITALINKTKPLAASNLKNHLNGEAI